MDTFLKKNKTSFAIKVAAIITMFIDHTAVVFLERQMANPNKAFVSGPEYYYAIGNIDNIMRGIGRIAFPLFIFLLVQGFMHTKNKYKYALRLGLFALISEIPFDMAFNNRTFNFSYQNVFFTLFLGFMFMLLTDLIYQKHIPPVLGYAGLVLGSLSAGSFIVMYLNMLIDNHLTASGRALYYGVLAFAAAILVIVEILACIKKPFEEVSRLSLSILVLSLAMWAAFYLKTDYNAAGVLAIAVAYSLRKKPLASFLGAYAVLVFFSSLFEVFAIFGVLLVARYNGEKGKSMKYFFYAFYPGHLLLLALVAMLLGL